MGHGVTEIRSVETSTTAGANRAQFAGGSTEASPCEAKKRMMESSKGREERSCRGVERKRRRRTVRATREPEGSSERVRGNTQNTETTSGGSAIPRLPTVVKR